MFCFIHSPNAGDCWGWIRMKPEDQNLLQVSLMIDSDSSTLSIIYCFQNAHWPEAGSGSRARIPALQSGMQTLRMASLLCHMPTTRRFFYTFINYKLLKFNCSFILFFQCIVDLVLKKALLFLLEYIYYYTLYTYICICEIPFSVEFWEGIEILVTFIIIIINTLQSYNVQL